MTSPAAEHGATGPGGLSPAATVKMLLGQFVPAVVSFRAGVICAAVAVVIGFTHPIAMSATEVLLGIMAFCWVLAGGYRERIEAITHNPVALAALALLALLALSMSYGSAPWSESVVVLAKYRNLIYLALFVSIFRTEFLRETGLWFFYAAMVVTLIGSFLTAAGMPLFEGHYTGNPGNATVFRNHIVQALCTSLFAYLMAHHFVDLPRWRWATGPLAVVAAWNVFAMLYSRSGYLAMAALILLFCFQRLRLRGLLYGAVAVSSLGVASYCLSETFSERVHVTADNVGAYLAYRFHGAPAVLEGKDRPVTKTSSGYRLEWYRFGMKLLAGNPILGVGVGSHKYHMEIVAEETGIQPNANMHSEYVMALTQLGLLGAVALGALLWLHWQVSRHLSPRMRYLAQAMLAILLVAGVMNSIISERSEGVLYAFTTGLAMAEYSQYALRARRQRRGDAPARLAKATPATRYRRAA